MKIYMIYNFEFLRIEFWEVPEGQHIDDIAGKYFAMDNMDEDSDNVFKTFNTIEEARTVAKELFDKDLKLHMEKINAILQGLPTKGPEAVRGRYPEDDN